MKLFIDALGYKRFRDDGHEGEKELKGKALEAALNADIEYRRNEAKLFDEAAESGERVDDTPLIVNSHPIYGPAKLGEIAPLLARSNQWQNAAEAKAIENSNFGGGEGQQGGGSDAGGGDAGAGR